MDIAKGLLLAALLLIPIVMTGAIFGPDRPMIFEDFRLTIQDVNAVLMPDNNYLRLDTTNDPLTAGLDINGSSDEIQYLFVETPHKLA